MLLFLFSHFDHRKAYHGIYQLKNEAQRNHFKTLHRDELNRNIPIGELNKKGSLEKQLSSVKSELETLNEERPTKDWLYKDQATNFSPNSTTASLLMGIIPHTPNRLNRGMGHALVEDFRIVVTHGFKEGAYWYVSDGTYAFSAERADNDYQRILFSIIKDIKQEIADELTTDDTNQS